MATVMVNEKLTAMQMERGDREYVISTPYCKEGNPTFIFPRVELY